MNWQNQDQICTCSMYESQRIESEEEKFHFPAVVLTICIVLAATIILCVVVLGR